MRRGCQDTRKKVMILMSDTGGGHRASAKALEDALEELYPGQIKVCVCVRQQVAVHAGCSSDALVLTCAL